MVSRDWYDGAVVVTVAALIGVAEKGHDDE